MKKLKEHIKHKILVWLGIEYQFIGDRNVNKIEDLEKGTGIGYIKFVRYGEYTGEEGTILDRLLKLEKKVYKKN